MNKKFHKINTHISNSWIFYVLSAVVSIILWSTAVVFVTKDKKEEVVTVYALAYSADVKSITSDLEENKDDYLKHVRFTFSDYTMELSNMTYEGLGKNYDIAILPESFLKRVAIPRFYIELDTTLINETFGVQKYYQFESKNFGIEIFNKDDIDDGLIKYTKKDVTPENYYLFINKSSLHMGEINDSSRSGGINVIKRLLG